jgi:alkanesulfonate monooxygenase SsuD/methylene tetrahydromethanopterin reductase-like flavin-dependent oxidoreductase (luciferase family)
MADEWIEIVRRLWQSWPSDAIKADVETGTFTDSTNIRPIDFHGEYFHCRGPLNMPAGPQGGAVICQAGGSPAGQAFGARHADTIIARSRGPEGAKAYRDDVQRSMAANGRPSDRCKILFSTTIVLGETVEEAQEKKRRLDEIAVKNLDARLAYMSFLSGKDFSRFDLDAPMPEVETNASRSLTKNLTSGTGKKTLREMASDTRSGGIDFVGTPDSIAAEMKETMRFVGGDGYLITEPLTRRTIAEITDGLAPALRNRGLLQHSYSHKLFRDNLLAF